ncbi:MAG: SDR family NAD(P)-dependent oxidoreductase [Acidimicrobiia bacterium]
MTPEPALVGRRAVVTGAASGLGRAFALGLGRAGADVALCDVDPAVEAVAAEVEDLGRRSLGVVADVADEDDVRSFVTTSADALGGIDLVVNNAGIIRATPPLGPDLSTAIRDFDDVVGVNLRGTFLVGRACMPHLVHRGGDVVNISTDHMHNCGYPVAVGHADAPLCLGATRRRPPGGGRDLDVYDASKWAITGLTLAWARALREHGVRVNTLGMGATDTPMYRAWIRAGGAPRPGLLSPEAVADVLVALVAEGPSGRTGDDVQVWDGHPVGLPAVFVDQDMVAAR